MGAGGTPTAAGDERKPTKSPVGDKTTADSTRTTDNQTASATSQMTTDSSKLLIISFIYKNCIKNTFVEI